MLSLKKNIPLKFRLMSILTMSHKCKIQTDLYSRGCQTFLHGELSQQIGQIDRLRSERVKTLVSSPGQPALPFGRIHRPSSGLWASWTKEIALMPLMHAVSAARQPCVPVEDLQVGVRHSASGLHERASAQAQFQRGYVS